jgi:cytochrome c oxidase subunit II
MGAETGDSQSVLDPRSPPAHEIADLWWFMLVASTVVVAVVTLLVLLAILRRRGRAGDRLAGRLGRPWLMVGGGLVFPMVLLAVLFALVLDTMVETAPSRERPVLDIEVTAEQFFWTARYPESGAVTANEIHIPAGQPVRVRLRTRDVIHSFWVPQLNHKIDMIPGRTNFLTLEADRPGVYRGQCAEFCGLGHANMAFLVIAEPPAAFERWLDNAAAPAARPASASARRGQRVFMTEGCASCHTIAGTEADGDVGPPLTHLADRRTLAAVTIPNTRGDLGGWVLDPQHIKPGNRMPAGELSGEELEALLDYLESLE